MAEPTNPYAAPLARVDDRRETSGERNFIEGGRAVAAEQGWRWIVDGWGLFKQFPGVWILMFIVYFVINVVLAFIPVVNLLVNLLIGVFTAGFMAGCRAIDDGQPLELGHLFAGFRERAGTLVLVGVIYLGAAMLLGFVLVFSLIGGVGALMTMDPMTMLRSGALFVVVFLALFIPIIMAYWYAPALVMLEDRTAVSAMKESFSGCARNVVPFLVYGICAMLLAVVAMIPFGLGLIVFVPTLTASIYASYKDVYYDQ
jgi:hypothetical protein